jgi:hypothetical protein
MKIDKKEREREKVAMDQRPILKMLRLFETGLAFSDAFLGTVGDCATFCGTFTDDMRLNTGMKAFS